MARLFISQEQLDRWTQEGKVRLDENNLMNLPALGRSFRLEPAVYAAKAIDGADGGKVLHKVKTERQLDELRAEHYGASLIVGETGYECIDGFVGTPVEDKAFAGSGLLRLEP